MASQMFDQPGATVQRSSSARHAQSAENISAKGVREFVSPINYADDGTTSRENGNSKNKKKQNKEKKSKKKGSKKTSSSSSSSSDEEREVLVVSTRNADASRNQELGQPETTVSSWQETAVGPESVVTEVDEKGNTITRTTRTQQVKHTVQTNTYQNFTIPDDEASYGVQSVERTHEELTPRGTKAGTSPVLHTQTRTLTLSAGGEPNSNDQLGEFVSSKTLTQGNRTVETLTYKTERDGVIETHVEHRVTILSGEDIDHDAELSAAILEATQINPDMTVEKIEVKQSTTA